MLSSKESRNKQRLLPPQNLHTTANKLSLPAYALSQKDSSQELNPWIVNSPRNNLLLHNYSEGSTKEDTKQNEGETAQDITKDEPKTTSVTTKASRARHSRPGNSRDREKPPLRNPNSNSDITSKRNSTTNEVQHTLDTSTHQTMNITNTELDEYIVKVNESKKTKGEPYSAPISQWSTERTRRIKSKPPRENERLSTKNHSISFEYTSKETIQ